jgi:hypothetical protein
MRLKKYLNEFSFSVDSHIKGKKSGLDKTLAKALVILNRKGYKTYSSHSGLKYDHKGKETSPSGYIAFRRKDLTPDQIKKITKIGKRYMDEVETWWPKIIVVRLWAKKESSPESEDHDFKYIKNKWIEFANKL